MTPYQRMLRRLVLDEMIAGFDEQVAELRHRSTPGLYKLRLVKEGPWVPARVLLEPSRDPVTDEVLDRSYLWQGIIFDEPDDRAGPRPTRRCFFIWSRGREIDEGEYRFLSEDLEWHLRRGYLSYREPVDINKLPAILPPGES